MLFVPTAYAPLKGTLFSVVLASIAFLAYRRQAIELHPTVIRWTAIMVATGIGFIGGALLRVTEQPHYGSGQFMFYGRWYTQC